MKIDEIIKKSIEIPGISIKRGEFTAELILKERDGKGSMTFFPLFPGVTLAYIFVNSPAWTAPDFHDNGSMETGPLLLNYCVTGRCELILNNGNFVYVKDGEISLTERFARQQYVYPRRIYEGIEFFVDMDTVNAQSSWVEAEFDIDFHRLRDLYCPDGGTYIASVTTEIEEVLKKLWSLLDISVPLAIPQMKIYTLALFSLLQNLKEIPPSQSCIFFTETQVDIAKRVEKIITSDLRQHHPAWELAAQFSVSETSLKNYFRGVYGQNISIYLREIRMQRAAELLTTTNLSVSEIAEQVGYLNQSKFSSAFKKQFNASPLEFKRRKNLERNTSN